MTQPSPPKTRRDFEVAIICALKLEGDAVEALFDHWWDDDGDRYGKAPGDQNAYVTGTIGCHNVVLAYMPQIGKVHAATVSANLRSSFENIKLALIVGICGGVPNGNTAGIFLGDVVISDKIVIYDRGKLFPGGFAISDGGTGSNGRPNSELQAFLNKLKRRKGHERLKTRTQHYLKFIQRRSTDYRNPGWDKDRLFDPTYHHKHRGDSKCKRCTKGETCKKAQGLTCEALGCENGRLLRRCHPVRATHSTGGQPELSDIHFGVVASADTVMKSGEDRDELARRESIIAFEMESAGAYDNLPCIVVKGVCDYADSHKDKVWQNYAAGAAAACMRSILEQWAVSSFLAEDEPAIGSQGKILTPHPTDISSISDDLSLSRTKMKSISEDSIPPPLHGHGAAYEQFNSRTENGAPQASVGGEIEPGIGESGGNLLHALVRVFSLFKEAIASLKKSRNYLPRDTDIKRVLSARRVTFQTSVEILISHAMGSPEISCSMVSDFDHPCWTNQELHTSIRRHLWSSLAACQEVTQDIQQKLVAISEFSKRLKKSTKGKEASGESGGALDQLNDLMDDIKCLIDLFSSLIPERSSPQLLAEPVARSQEERRGLQHFRVVQKAAYSLYDALAKSCSEHTIHDVHLSLEPSLDGTLTRVGFKVALNASQLPDAQANSRAVWINVESVIKATITDPEPSSQLALAGNNSLKRQCASDETSRHEVRKRVHFQRITESIQTCLPNLVDLNIPNLYLQRNLCSVVQRQLHRELAKCNNCIGVLGDNENCKHLVYIQQKTEVITTPASLSQLISLSKTDPTSGLGMYGRVRLAKYLAAAILYYHATPWLKGPWCSDDVHFFGRDESHCPPEMRQPIPYMSTSIQDSTSPEAADALPPGASCLSRNPALFGLGVILLELAYRTPFKSLQKEIDLKLGKAQDVANFLTAQRVVDCMNGELGKGFKDIVKKCLDCDFGKGNDLKDPGLQEAFYHDVIGGLERLEKMFQELELED